ncbi:MAG: hypothetical protein AAGJ81_01385 [Verrucomicrobiota bacterium]
MVDTLTPPSAGGAAPAAPTALPVAGAGSVPIETVAGYGDPAAISIDLAGASSGRIRAGAAENLSTLTLVNAGAGLTFAELVIPASVNSVDLGAGCAQGDWVDQLIAALPDRSLSNDGEYTDTGAILTGDQVAALNAKGFAEA